MSIEVITNTFPEFEVKNMGDWFHWNIDDEHYQDTSHITVLIFYCKLEYESNKEKYRLFCQRKFSFPIPDTKNDLRNTVYDKVQIALSEFNLFLKKSDNPNFKKKQFPQQFKAESLNQIELALNFDQIALIKRLFNR